MARKSSSQELILDKGDKKGQKSKILYSVRCRGHPLAEDRQCPAHHRYLVSRRRWPRPHRRSPTAPSRPGAKPIASPSRKLDFYTLLDNWVLRDEAPAVEQQHCVIANLIRGGVFGEAEEK
ncbi:type I-F CRISPR-associated protein Cas7f/Csy3 [Pseudomonas aeruginosa]|nr:type I-F CRISPR-associated protein Cas7f/Csy3 [Pseudomonas aeruginosa]